MTKSNPDNTTLPYYDVMNTQDVFSSDLHRVELFDGMARLVFAVRKISDGKPQLEPTVNLIVPAHKLARMIRQLQNAGDSDDLANFNTEFRLAS